MKPMRVPMIGGPCDGREMTVTDPRLPVRIPVTVNASWDDRSPNAPVLVVENYLPHTIDHYGITAVAFVHEGLDFAKLPTGMLNKVLRRYGVTG